MSTHKHIDLICICAIVLTLLIMILFINGESLGITAMTDAEDVGFFTENDLLADWNTSDATIISLSGNAGTVTGTGAYIADGDVHIAFAGKYVLSGELTDGSIIIDADGDDKIWLLLDGISVHCEDNAAILIRQAKKVFLTLAPGKVNTVSGGAVISASSSRAKTDGVIYSRDDLTINGRGTLQVHSEYQHGIVCNDNLVITDGEIHILAPQDGIHAHDSVKIANATLQISAKDDGITVENDERTDRLDIISGTITITDCYEGLEASYISVTGGTIDITPTDDGINAQHCIEIAGGDIRIVNETGRDADGLDSNGDIIISGGNLFISVNTNGGSCAIDYGSEQGGTCTINGGTVIACGSTVLAEEISSSSAQNFIMHQVSGEAGELLKLQDQSGKEILSETVPCAFSLVTLSDPTLIKGDTYSLSVGNQTETITVDNSSEVSGFGGFGGFGGGRDMFFNGDFAGGPGKRPDDGFKGGKPTGNFKRDPNNIPEDFKDGKPDFMPGAPDAVPAMEQMPPDDIPDDFKDKKGGRENWSPNGDISAQPDKSPYINSQTFILIGVSAFLLALALLIAYKYKE